MNDLFSHMLADPKKDQDQALNPAVDALVSQAIGHASRPAKVPAFWVEHKQFGERGYWYLRWIDNGVRRSRYIGAGLDRQKIGQIIASAVT